MKTMVLMVVAMLFAPRVVAQDVCYDEAGDPRPLRVLVLSDDREQAPVLRDSLALMGFDVTDGGYFWEWNGVEPYAGDFDAVLFAELSCETANTGLTSAGDAALTAYMLAGHPVIRTEWGGYARAWGGPEYTGIPEDCESQIDFDQYLPTCTDVPGYEGDFHYDTVWSKTEEHPMTEGLPLSWTDGGGGCTPSRPRDENTVVLATAACSYDPSAPFGPVLSYREWGDNGGMVVYINSEFRMDQATGMDDLALPDMDIMQVLANAITFGASN